MSENWDLFGHEWAVEMLRRHVAEGEARHAYLLAGPPGIGRRTLALRFAKALNCTQPPAAGEFCGECRDCKQIEKMQHPDLAVIQAESEGSMLKVDQVRAVQHSLSLKPYQSKYRVALFLRFQEANDNASNALLKTLEEAPPYAVLLLTADSPEQLLPTIVSRCEVLRLRAPKVEDLERMLQGRAVEPQKARLLAHISGGRPGYAERLLLDDKLLESRTRRLDELGALIQSTRVQKFAYAEKLAKDKEAMRAAMLLWLSFWHDVMITTAQAETCLTNLDYAEQVERAAAKLSLPAARKIVADLEMGLERLDHNVNARLLLEVLLLDWPRIVSS